MSEPLRITCQTKADMPALEEIRRLVTREQHLVLQFLVTGKSVIPGKIQKLLKRRRISSLAWRLPEYRVFDSGIRVDGSECITIKLVIAQELVLVHAQAFVDAAHQFRKTAFELISLLAQRLDIPVEAVNERLRFGLSDNLYTGDLTDGWHYSSWFSV